MFVCVAGELYFPTTVCPKKTFTGEELRRVAHLALGSEEVRGAASATAVQAKADLLAMQIPREHLSPPLLLGLVRLRLNPHSRENSRRRARAS